MTLAELAALFDGGRRRWHYVGSAEAGVAIGLDLEGRLFTVVGNRVLNRVNPEAFSGTSSREVYLNPGGDGLWPAPEGSALGYEYSTSAWRVPPNLTSARFVVLDSGPTWAHVRAEIDLVNARGTGVPTAFERRIEVFPLVTGIEVRATETIEYLGRWPRRRDEVVLAPWSLCQFDSGPESFACFPEAGADSVWDLYDGSEGRRQSDGRVVRTRTDGGPRYQVGLSPRVDWIEYHHPRASLVVRRTADPMPEDVPYVDIADRDPEVLPEGRPVRFSIYSDPSMFMEIEAAGGCPESLLPGTRLDLRVTTQYRVTGE